MVPTGLSRWSRRALTLGCASLVVAAGALVPGQLHGQDAATRALPQPLPTHSAAAPIAAGVTTSPPVPTTSAPAGPVASTPTTHEAAPTTVPPAPAVPTVPAVPGGTAADPAANHSPARVAAKAKAKPKAKPKAKTTTKAKAKTTTKAKTTASVKSASASRSAATAVESGYASAILSMLNGERAQHGLKALRMNNQLISSARVHNLNMARANTMSHQLPGEANFADRIQAAGYYWIWAGENVGWNSDMSLAGVKVLESMMYNEKPPNDGHRQNILSTHFTEIGIDVYLDNVNHKVWITEDFGSRS